MEDGDGAPPDLSGPPGYIETLNDAQRIAVTFPNDVPLQILAGPGSGKTRVLTARVAYLVHHHGLRPWEITAVTFTNKAAQEMRKRLNVLLGEGVAGKLVLGTFHATCANYLRRYGTKYIDLPSNFSITDSDDTRKLINSILKPLQPELKANHYALKDQQAMGEISKSKAREEGWEGMHARAVGLGDKGAILRVIAQVYKQYEQALFDSSSLDFDDLLLYGLKLFRQAPEIVAGCKHILVDEFQDTNTTQYELMKLFAKAHGRVTVVGDPDQSIYGWRSAEIENLNRMKRDFPDTDAVYLEENYRSTGAILAASLAIVSQDKERIAKGLITSHPTGLPVTLKLCPSAPAEASFVAQEIKRHIAYSGGMLKYDDFAILLRYNALSRPLEQALQRESIPHRLVGGHKFFERMEVKDLLGYLQLVDNPNFLPAFARVVNVPKRAVGEKTVQDLVTKAKDLRITPMQLAERVASGEEIAGVKPNVKKSLATFVSVIDTLREKAEEHLPVADLIRLLLELIKYEDHLRKGEDFESRWENVQELISYAVIISEERVNAFGEEGDDDTDAYAFEEERGEGPSRPAAMAPKVHPFFHRKTSSIGGSSISKGVSERPMVKRDRRSSHNVGGSFTSAIDLQESDDDLTPLSETPDEPSYKMDESDNDLERDDAPVDDGLAERRPSTPLRLFLEASMLATDSDGKTDGKDQPKVTICTVHSAKGLEWPVIFLPCIEQGTYPFYRSTEDQEIREERRLLYVAMTRARAALVMSYSKARILGGEMQDRELSQFVASAYKDTPNIFALDTTPILAPERKSMAVILERPEADEKELVGLISTYNATAKPDTSWEGVAARDAFTTRNPRSTATMFWDNSTKKEKRAREYWHSEQDEYALPPMADDGQRRTMAKVEDVDNGFVSAKSLAGPSDVHTSPSAVVAAREARLARSPITASKLEYPEPLPFTFGGFAGLADVAVPERKPAVDFSRTQQSSLNMMKTLGLPAPVSHLDRPRQEPVVPQSRDVARFQSSSNSALAFMKGLGSPSLESADRPGFLPGQASVGSSRSSGSGGGGVSAAYTIPTFHAGMQSVTKVGGGNKRLGMGRPPAPWGSKKAKME